MSQTTPTNEVISLACVRFEETLAEGPLSAFSHPHRMECESCAALAHELMAEDGLFDSIAQVSGPVEMPPGFVDAVLMRAAVPEPKQVEAPVSDARLTWMHYGLSGLLAGTVAALVTWIVHQPPPPQPTDTARPALVAVEKAPTAAQPKVAVVPVATVPGHKVQAPAVKPAASPLKAPVRAVAVRAPKVPEPSVKLPEEIRTAILRHIRSLPFCPKRINGSVRVTLTVEKSGKVTNRQVLSGSGQSSAHQCVNLGIDKLMLPPMKQATGITVELSW